MHTPGLPCLTKAHYNEPLSNSALHIKGDKNGQNSNQ